MKLKKKEKEHEVDPYYIKAAKRAAGLSYSDIFDWADVAITSIGKALGGLRKETATDKKHEVLLELRRAAIEFEAVADELIFRSGIK